MKSVKTEREGDGFSELELELHLWISSKTFLSNSGLMGICVTEAGVLYETERQLAVWTVFPVNK